MDINFKNPFLSLAHNLYRISYITNEPRVAFTLLMTSLESLFVESNTELSNRLCRNIALALCTTLKESQDLFFEMKKLYNIRSKFIHGEIIKDKDEGFEDMHKLRDIVRRGILFYIDNGYNNKDFNKKEFLDKLVLAGYKIEL